jgi:hypothetical protein
VHLVPVRAHLGDGFRPIIAMTLVMLPERLPPHSLDVNSTGRRKRSETPTLA